MHGGGRSKGTEQQVDQDLVKTADLVCQKEPVLITLTLALDFSAAGAAGSQKRESFKALVVSDLARAAGVDAECFAVTELQPGSIILSVCISSLDQGGAACDPAAVLADLTTQARDPSSQLMAGALTKDTLSLEQDTCSQSMETRDNRSEKTKLLQDLQQLESQVPIDP